SNAVKFTPQGGHLGLEIEASPDEGVVCFTVWDDGIGISASDRSRLFTPFVQLDSRLAREYSGTGLGLSLVQRLVELHDGEVELESELGSGSRFRVKLPWHAGLAPKASPPKNTRMASFSVEQALTIEDTAIDAEHITRCLADVGIANIVQARGAGSADLIAKVQPGVVFLDVKLPDALGWEVLRELKADSRIAHIPIVIVSVLD
ncbi:MAG: response regulator, partial [Myxococcales bacterium]|nr:response regulator [Myxococcales bacterium]